MRQINLLILIGVMALFAGTSLAQKKAVKKTPAKKTPAEPVRVVSPLDVRVAREKVEIQLSNVTRFVDVLGPIAQSIELLDESSRIKSLPQATLDKNQANKQRVIEAIRNLRTGIAAVETDFRTKSALQQYLPSIQGVTDLGSESEDAALAGRFVAAKDPLRDIIRKLTDTLAALPRT